MTRSVCWGDTPFGTGQVGVVSNMSEGASCLRERQCSGTLLMLFAVFCAWLSISSTAVGQTPHKRLFGHGQPSVLTYSPQPVLPCLARAARIEGDVRLALVV